MTPVLAHHLQTLADRYEQPDFIPSDPISYPRSFMRPDGLLPLSLQQDIETAAVIASWLAYGRRASILEAIGKVSAELGPEPSLALEEVADRFNGVEVPLYRFFTYADLSDLADTLAAVFYRYSTLKTYIRSSCRPPLEALCKLFSHIRGFPCCTRSACKRLNLLLRWMARRDSPVDLGLWSGFIPASSLIIPLDTHVHRQALALGLTCRRTPDMKAALEVTSALSESFPGDPTRGDFALFGHSVTSATQVIPTP